MNKRKNSLSSKNLILAPPVCPEEAATKPFCQHHGGLLFDPKMPSSLSAKYTFQTDLHR